jgi:hypothetical protein
MKREMAWKQVCKKIMGRAFVGTAYIFLRGWLCRSWFDVEYGKQARYVGRSVSLP